jgi:hypothetical protein
MVVVFIPSSFDKKTLAAPKKGVQGANTFFIEVY